MSRPSSETTSPSVVRAAQVLKLLSGRTNIGMRSGEIATALKIPPARVSNILQALEDEGLVTKVYTPDNQDTERYAHSTGLLQMAYDCMHEDQLIKHRIDQKQKMLMNGGGK